MKDGNSPEPLQVLPTVLYTSRHSAAFRLSWSTTASSRTVRAMGRWNVPLCWLRFSCDLSCPIWQPAESMRHQSSLPGTVQYCTHLLGRQDRPAIHPAISQQCIYYRRPGVGRLCLPCHQDLSLTDLGPATGRGFAGSPSVLTHLCWASFLPRHQHQSQLIRTGERCRATWIAGARPLHRRPRPTKSGPRRVAQPPLARPSVILARARRGTVPLTSQPPPGATNWHWGPGGRGWMDG